MELKEPVFTDTGAEDASWSVLQSTLRERKTALLRGNKHVWVLSMVYLVEDPLADPDDLNLTLDLLVDTAPLHCLFCGVGFRPGTAGTHCDRVIKRLRI